jgi:hypothetical protein
MECRHAGSRATPQPMVRIVTRIQLCALQCGGRLETEVFHGREIRILLQFLLNEEELL